MWLDLVTEIIVVPCPYFFLDIQPNQFVITSNAWSLKLEWALSKFPLLNPLRCRVASNQRIWISISSAIGVDVIMSGLVVYVICHSEVFITMEINVCEFDLSFKLLSQSSERFSILFGSFLAHSDKSDEIWCFGNVFALIIDYIFSVSISCKESQMFGNWSRHII